MLVSIHLSHFCLAKIFFDRSPDYFAQCRQYRMPMHHKHDTLQYVYFASCTQANGKLDSVIYTLRTNQLYLVVNVWIKASDILDFLQTLLQNCVHVHLLVPQCVSSLVLRSVCVYPPPIDTCKQHCVYQFPVVILSLSASGLNMIIDSIKRGPSIASRHLDLHLYSPCDGVLLMQWNLSLARG